MVLIGHRKVRNFVTAIFFIECKITSPPYTVESVIIRNGGGHNGCRSLPVKNNNRSFSCRALWDRPVAHLVDFPTNNVYLCR